MRVEQNYVYVFRVKKYISVFHNFENITANLVKPENKTVNRMCKVGT